MALQERLPLGPVGPIRVAQQATVPLDPSGRLPMDVVAEAPDLAVDAAAAARRIVRDQRGNGRNLLALR